MCNHMEINKWWLSQGINKWKKWTIKCSGPLIIIWTQSRVQASALCFLSLFGVLGARPTHPVRLQAYTATQAERWKGQPFPWSPSFRHGNKLYKQTIIISSDNDSYHLTNYTLANRHQINCLQHNCRQLIQNIVKSHIGVFYRDQYHR